MLRNSYFESYKREKRKKSEYEKLILKNDGEHILSLERPLSIINLKKLTKSDFPLFVNDLMCEKKTGHLIFPLSFQKHVNFFLKQQSYAYRITTFNKNKNYIDMIKALKEKRAKEIEENTKNKTLSSPKLSNFKKRDEIREMKINLSSFKSNKNYMMKKLKSKNRKFYKSQPLIDRKLRKLMYQSVNDIRLRGYEKAFEDCCDRSLSNQKFKLPEVGIDESNVYSRLYNNIIMKNNSRNFNNNYSQIIEAKYKNDKNKINSFSVSMNIDHKKPKTSYIQKEEEPIRKKGPEFHITSINKNLDGKEFTKKITKKMYTRCLSALSGGPRDNFRKNQYNFNLNSNFFKNKREKIENKIKKKYINYHAKLTSKNCFLKMKPDTTIKKESNSYSIDQEKINRLILANSNSRVDLINTKKFRDYNYNTNLHRSVLKNNIKFVEYFLKKGLDVNKKNKNGDTALHFAFKIKNYDIIQLLLEYGASIKIKNNKGITTFEVANKDIKDTFNLVEIYNNPDEY